MPRMNENREESLTGPRPELDHNELKALAKLIPSASICKFLRLKLEWSEDAIRDAKLMIINEEKIFKMVKEAHRRGQDTFIAAFGRPAQGLRLEEWYYEIAGKIKERGVRDVETTYPNLFELKDVDKQDIPPSTDLTKILDQWCRNHAEGQNAAFETLKSRFEELQNPPRAFNLQDQPTGDDDDVLAN